MISPDLIVEIVSDSSFQKDNQRLMSAYCAAGITEYWIVDARKDPLFFQINLSAQDGFSPAEPDKEGFQASGVLSRRFRIDRDRSSRGYWRYEIRRLGSDE